jgi:glycerol-3-phosphate dehydrogenase (NAD(P)+)
MTDKTKVSVIGAGAWGTAIAWALADNGHDVAIWAIEPEVVYDINNAHENKIYLPGVSLPESITATPDLREAVKDRPVHIFVVPSQFMRPVFKSLGEILPDDAIVVSATKGIEIETLAMAVDVASETLPEPVYKRFCALSGPTFAKELVKRAPSAATIASFDHEAAVIAQQALMAPYFRIYVHDDVVGLEIGGAIKNVIAIAAGIAHGLGFGPNTQAALITRGLSELARLGAAVGGKEETFYGLSGMGDLVLTCSGSLSRNRTVGERLGKGESLEEIKASMKAVAEGVATSLSVRRLAEKYNVDMPIAEEVFRVIYEGKDPKTAVIDLMGREPKEEFSKPS